MPGEKEFLLGYGLLLREGLKLTIHGIAYVYFKLILATILGG